MRKGGIRINGGYVLRVEEVWMLSTRKCRKCPNSLSILTRFVENIGEGKHTIDPLPVLSQTYGCEL